MQFPELTGAKIRLRAAGWTWNRKLRRWEKGDAVAKNVDDAARIQRDAEELAASSFDSRPEI